MLPERMLSWIQMPVYVNNVLSYVNDMLINTACLPLFRILNYYHYHYHYH